MTERAAGAGLPAGKGDRKQGYRGRRGAMGIVVVRAQLCTFSQIQQMAGTLGASHTLPMNCTSIKMIKNKSVVDGRGALGHRKWTLAKDFLVPV